MDKKVMRLWLVKFWEDFIESEIKARFDVENGDTPSPEALRYIKEHVSLVDFMEWLDTRE